MAISLNEINKITMQVLNKHHKAAIEPGEPVAPKMKYKINTLQSGFDVTDGGKTYFIPAEDLKYKNTSINAFWDDLSPEAKDIYLVSNQANQTPKTGYSAVLAALGKAPFKQAELPFASLQEMYDTAKPAKGKKGAAKSLGKKIIPSQYAVNTIVTDSSGKSKMTTNNDLLNWAYESVKQAQKP